MVDKHDPVDTSVKHCHPDSTSLDAHWRLECPALRWSSYIFTLRSYGIPIETEIEAHDGEYAGRHARYRLMCDATLRVLEVEK